jgi:hypothetical protein
MDKKHIVKFLRDKKRGVYTLIVNVYSDTIMSIGKTMALEVIKEDLERETGEKVDLNYFSLAQAISKYKGSNPKSENEKRRWEFKDANELNSDQIKPGKFKLD